MAIYKINIKSNLDAMAGESRFIKTQDGVPKLVRFVPPVSEDGHIFIKMKNHYKFKNQDGRSIALANLELHGTEETGTEDYIEQLSNILLEYGNEAEQKIGKAIAGSERYGAQLFEATKQEDGSFKWNKAIKLMSLPYKSAQSVLDIAKSQEYMNRPPHCDPEEGEALVYTRTGSGFQTKHHFERSGLVGPLSDFVPGWEDKIYTDLYDAFLMNVLTPEDQKQIAMLSYPDLDWEKLESEYGL